MFYVARFLALISMTAVLMSCASSDRLPPPPTEYEAAHAFEGDSLSTTLYDDLFLEIHGKISEELERREENGKQNASLIEVRSLVKIAEEFYLEGNVYRAIKLLGEAELLLRQAP